MYIAEILSKHHFYCKKFFKKLQPQNIKHNTEIRIMFQKNQPFIKGQKCSGEIAKNYCCLINAIE